MRTHVFAANWKMHTDAEAAPALAGEVAERVREVRGREVILCPPFPFLAQVRAAVGREAIGVGAQNLHHETKGAYTGEVSGPMLRSLGCSHVIVGHSERRALFGDTDDAVARKLRAALAARLTPILCVGETLAERESGRTEAVVGGQLDAALAGLPRFQVQASILAYEPVWAIGTGRNATPGMAGEVHAFLRNRLAETYDRPLAEAVRILYGGSVKPTNVRSLMEVPDIDGALVGGASLEAGSFADIVRWDDGSSAHPEIGSPCTRSSSS